MRKVLLFLVIAGVLAWIADSSGIGIPRSVGVGADWARQAHSQYPQQVYVFYKGSEYLIKDITQVNEAIDVLGKREAVHRYSLFGRPLPDAKEKKDNEIWVQYQGKAFEKIVSFGDPMDDLGKEMTDYLNGLQGKASPPPANFSLNSDQAPS